jgi:hypothetical protein
VFVTPGGKEKIILTKDPNSTWESALLKNPRMAVRHIIPMIVSKKKLPIAGKDGAPVRYRLFWKKGARFLAEDESLPSIGRVDWEQFSLISDSGDKLQS